MRDRLTEFRRSSVIDLEAADDATAGLLRDIRYIETAITSFTDATRAIDRLHASTLAAMSLSEESQIQEEVSQLTKQTNSVANMIRHKIKNLQSQHMGADPRLRAVHYARLSKLFTDSLVRYREMQNSFASKQKEKVKRQIRIVEPSISDDELEKVVNSSDEPRKMFEHKLRTHRHVAAFEEVEDRHQALVKLSETIQEIQDLFADMQQFTERQETILMQIDKHLGAGNAYLTDGTTEMKDAAALTRANRRRMAIILTCLFLLIVAAGVLVFVYVVQPNLKKNNGSIPSTSTPPAALPENVS